MFTPITCQATSDMDKHDVVKHLRLVLQYTWRRVVTVFTEVIICLYFREYSVT